MSAGRPKGTGRRIVAVRRQKVTWTLDPVLRQQIADMARSAGMAESALAEGALRRGLARMWLVATSRSSWTWILIAPDANGALRTVIEQCAGTTVWRGDVLAAVPLIQKDHGLFEHDTDTDDTGTVVVGSPGEFPDAPLHADDAVTEPTHPPTDPEEPWAAT